MSVFLFCYFVKRYLILIANILSEYFLYHNWKYYQQITSLAAFRCNAQCFITDINQRGVEILGYRPDEVKGLTVDDVTFADDLKQDQDLINQLVAGRQSVISRYKRYIRKNGEVFLALATLTVQRSLFGYQYIGFIYQVPDFSSSLQFYQSQKKLAVLKHEVRHSLTGILTYGQAIFGALTNNPLQIQAQQIINFAHAIDDLLIHYDHGGFSSTLKSKQEESFFNMQDVVSPVVEYYRLLSQKKGLLFSWDVMAAEDCSLAGTGIWIQQILHNLLSNALKNTPSGRVGGKLSSVRHELDNTIHYEFVVFDSGNGFPQKFSRDWTHWKPMHAQFVDEKHGLDVVKELVDLMAGEMEIRSRHSLGSSITVRVALNVAGGSAFKSKSLALGSRIHSLLVLDDDALSCWWLKKLLADCDVIIEEAHAIGAAQQALLKQPYDLLMIDLSLVDENGLEFVLWVKQFQKQLGFKYVVLLTGHEKEGLSHWQSMQYVDAILTKPINQQKLVSLLNELV